MNKIVVLIMSLYWKCLIGNSSLWKLKYLPVLLLLISTSLNLFAKKAVSNESGFPLISKQEKIKKLLFLPIANFDNHQQTQDASQLITEQTLGGIIIQNGGINEVKEWIVRMKYRNESSPLFLLNMSNLLSFPLYGLPKFPSIRQIELISDESSIYNLGHKIGELAKNTGFDMIIIDPSKIDSTLLFKAKPKSWIKHYLKGISQSGISISFGEANPIPFVNHRFSLDEITANIAVKGVLINKISLLEKENLISNKYKKQIGYDGLIFKKADFLSNWNTYFSEGNDILILPSKLSEAKSIINYFTFENRLKNKYLKAKYENLSSIQKQIKAQVKPTLDWKITSQQLSEIFYDIQLGAVACLKNDEEILPFKNLDFSNFASISGSSNEDQIFRKSLDKYTRIAHYDFNYIFQNPEKGLATLSHFNTIIVKINHSEANQASIIDFLKKLKTGSKIIVSYFGSHDKLKAWEDFDALIWTPETKAEYARLLSQSLFGARKVNGIFPYKSDSTNSKQLTLQASDRLKYPLFKSDDYSSLYKIDMIVNDAITTHVIPGCQVLMIKNGTVVYEKSFGYYTYDSLIQVEDFSIYDIASVTKVAATLPSIMFLNEREKISVKGKIGDYLQHFKQSDKSSISIQSLLQHQSGLRSYLPFWKKAGSKNGADFKYKLPKRNRRYYRHKSLNINWNDSIQDWIASSKYNSLKQKDGSYGYLYSDLGFMLLKNIAESQLNQPINEFLNQNIYAPLGMYSTVFQPLCQRPKDEIVPTENDYYFRKELVWGNVHDQNAALTNGISGHAGLFSNAGDLGKYLQMHLQKGKYGGIEYFQPSTINKYTSKPTTSKRRALGWDKPVRTIGNVSKYASDSSYGHTGFTGTMVWTDPKYEMVYVFLSNRVYPDAKNNKLAQNNIRTRIQDIMYESFLKTKFE